MKKLEQLLLLNNPVQGSIAKTTTEMWLFFVCVDFDNYLSSLINSLMIRVMKTKEIAAVQNLVLTWYEKEGRDLPWRHTDDLYRITLSEIMLQQTNVPKVIEKYHAFLKRFPTVDKLARARQSSVVKQWQGLGYNRRALNLHKLAKIITSDYCGIFPENPEELGALPGIGPYTKNAILAFGRNRHVSAVDVNIERFIRRLHGHGTWPEGSDTAQICYNFVPEKRSRDWHNAVMDVASIYCTKKKPDCETCPLRTICKSYPAPIEPIVIKKKERGATERGKHIPDRIYRGRVVQVLRERSASPDEIGLAIKSDWSESDREWLEKILEKLKVEGMIKYTGKSWQLK